MNHPLRQTALWGILCLAAAVGMMRLNSRRGGAREVRAPEPIPQLVLTGSLSGSVVADDGSPVANARVVWMVRRGIRAVIVTESRTDARGGFRLTGLPTASNDAPAALAALVGQRIVAMVGRSALGADTGIALRRADAVTARIPLLGTNRTPLVGIGARPWILVPEAGWFPAAGDERFQTDPHGVVVFQRLPRNAFLRVELLPLDLAAPQALDRIALRTEPVRSFGETVVPRAGKIAGRVLRKDGRTAAGRTVEGFRLQGGGGSGYFQTRVGADGGFLIPRLAPGEYLVRVQTPGSDPELQACLPASGVIVDEGRTTALSPFRLERGGRIAGRVRSGDEGLGLGGMHVLATPIDAAGEASGTTLDTISNREGAFSTCLPPGRYRIAGLYYGGDAFMAMRSRTVVTPETVTVVPGARIGVQILHIQEMTGGETGNFRTR